MCTLVGVPRQAFRDSDSWRKNPVQSCTERSTKFATRSRLWMQICAAIFLHGTKHMGLELAIGIAKLLIGVGNLRLDLASAIQSLGFRGRRPSPRPCKCRLGRCSSRRGRQPSSQTPCSRRASCPPPRDAQSPCRRRTCPCCRFSVSSFQGSGLVGFGVGQFQGFKVEILESFHGLQR
jgi:hypothetical protein